MVAMSALNEKTAEIEQNVKMFKGKFDEIITLLKGDKKEWVTRWP